MADKTPGQDLADTLKDTPGRVMDTLTLGPQRRRLGKYIDEKESEASEWLNKPIGKKSVPKASGRKAVLADKRTPRKRG